MSRRWWPPLVVAGVAVSWSVPLFAKAWVLGALALGCAAAGIVAALTMRATSRLVWWWPLILAVLGALWSVPLFEDSWVLGVLALGCAVGGFIAALTMHAVETHSHRVGSPGGSIEP